MITEDKYEIQLWSESTEPLMPVLQATYILTMSDSTRVAHLDQRLYNIARRTYVQTNAGYWNRPTDGVDCSSRDIVHAVRNLCEHAGRTHVGYILVLEDDALLLTTSMFDAINQKLYQANIDVYTLGSIGFFLPFGCNHARIFGNFIGFAQAMIYSSETQTQLLRTPIKNIKHIDAHFLAHRPKKYACTRPVIVQYLPRTSNMTQWSLSYESGVCERCGVQIFIFILHSILRLDRHHCGWYALYFLNYATIPTLILCVVTIIIAAINCSTTLLNS